MTHNNETVFRSFGESLINELSARKIKEAHSSDRPHEIVAYLDTVSRHIKEFEDLQKAIPSAELESCIASFRFLLDSLMPAANKLMQSSGIMEFNQAENDHEVEHRCDKVGEHSREAFNELFSETRERERVEIIREWAANIRADLSDCIDIITGRKEE